MMVAIERGAPVAVGLHQPVDIEGTVVSEIVDGLERRGLLMRDRDPADRRRTLVWLPAGTEALRRDDEVLSEAALAAAMTRMTDEDRRALLTGAAALVAAAPLPSPHPTTEDRP